MGYQFAWEVIYEYRALLLHGLWMTLVLSALVFIFSLPLAIIVAVLRTSRHRLVAQITRLYIEVFRNTPLIVQLFFWYFAVNLDAFAASTFGLVLYSSVYMGETIRSGVLSIAKTQYDAAYASGLSSFHVARYVILPQALMIVIPPLGTELINVIKNSSLAMTITVRELTFQTQEIDAITYRGFEAATVVTLVYLGLAVLIVSILTIIERRLKFSSKVL